MDWKEGEGRRAGGRREGGEERERCKASLNLSRLALLSPDNNSLPPPSTHLSRLSRLPTPLPPTHTHLCALRCGTPGSTRMMSQQASERRNMQGLQNRSNHIDTTLDRLLCLNYKASPCESAHSHQPGGLSRHHTHTGQDLCVCVSVCVCVSH